MALKPRLWTAAACWLLCAVPAPAQHWSFQMYDAGAGLTNSNILVIHQDRQGYLWMSTEGGLFRYDGDRFQLFDAANVNSIYSSPDGQLWTASSAGLFRFAGNRLAPVRAFAHVPLESGQAIASDAANLYVATPSGLRSLPLRGAGPVRVLSQKASSAVLVASGGAVWFGCGVRLCSLQDGRQREWPLAAGGPWQSMVEDADGRLWIRSADKVLVRLSPRSPFQEVPGLGKLNSTRGSLLGTGPLGDVLIPHAAGLTICNGLDCRTYGAESGLRRAEVYAAAEDREGSIWLGYSGHGLARWLGRNRWQSFTEQEGLTELGIWRIVRDAAGDMWIGTNRGLFHGVSTAGRWRFERSDAVGELTVYGLAAEPDGSLWVGTFQTETNGLVRYYPRTRRKWVYPPPNTGIKLSINDISRDETGAIWVGTANGVMRLPPGAGRLERVPLPLDGASVFEVRCSRGSLLAAGKKGLYIQRGAVHRLLTVADGLKDNAVQSVAIGPDGAIWAVYFSPLGITRIDLDGAHLEMRHFTVAEGLPDDTVYSQFFDARGRHWLGSGNGVAVSQGDRWIAYDTSDGLVWNDCNAHSYRAEPDGAVWIGTSGGLARFFPLASPAVSPATPLITSAWRNDLPATGPDFNASTHTIAFRFTILSYAKETTRFRYRLGTGDRPWVETRAHEARFAELPPNSYRFEVEAETGPGTWGRPAAFEFRILPHWYLSWPFQTGLLLSLSALIWLWWRQREVRQRAVRAILEATVRERTRDLSAATERAEQANRVKGEFLANMSHEMRTPLNGVIGLTQLALELSTQPEVLDHLRIAQLSAKSLLSLINDVLDFSKIEAGHLEVDPAVFELRPFVAEVQAILEPEASRKALSLQGTVDGSVPGWVLADNRRLRQVLLNLVGNAIKFTEAGTVSVGVRRVENELWFAVADTGIGIPADKQAIIFDAFRQADNSTSRRHGGTGLGLTISRRLVELMGGSLSLESQPGRGTTFSFSIRAPEAVAPFSTGDPRAEAPVRPLRILVAEDHRVNQHLIMALLRRLGHIPTLAANGLEALEALARDRFDLILMDIQMPEMDGLEAVRRIRQAERASGGHIPVVALTARSSEGDRELILEAGMDEYLLKPIQTERLAAVLETALTR